MMALRLPRRLSFLKCMCEAKEVKQQRKLNNAIVWEAKEIQQQRKLNNALVLLDALAQVGW